MQVGISRRREHTQCAAAYCLHPHLSDLALHHDAAEIAPTAGAHCRKQSGEESFPVPKKAA